jgi:hypothetical protein
MDMVGNDGDLSSDQESFNQSYERSGSFKESGGHRVTRLNGKNRRRKMNKERRKKGCKC